jgi:hypothetical protein
MIYDGINLNEASLEDIRNMEIEHVATQLIALGLNKRLCSMEGREIIAEHNLSGDINEVANKLNMYSIMLKRIDLNEQLRSDIIERKTILMNHRENADSDDKASQQKLDSMMEAIKTHDPETIIKTAMDNYNNPSNQDVKIRNDALHDAKLCECYTN